MLMCDFLFNNPYTFFGEENDNPLQYSRLENPVDKETWWATVHWVTKESGMI